MSTKTRSLHVRFCSLLAVLTVTQFSWPLIACLFSCHKTRSRNSLLVVLRRLLIVDDFGRTIAIATTQTPSSHSAWTRNWSMQTSTFGHTDRLTTRPPRFMRWWKRTRTAHCCRNDRTRAANRLRTQLQPHRTPITTQRTTGVTI